MAEVVTINAADMRRETSEVMAQVAHGGKRFIVERHGRPMMALVSIEDLLRLQELEKSTVATRRYRGLLSDAAALRHRILEARGGFLLPDSTDALRSIRDEG